MDFSMGAIWAQMGLFARFIMVVLGIMSLWSIYVMAERLLVYYRAQKASRLFAAEIADALEKGELETAMRAYGPNRGHLANVIGAGLNAWAKGAGDAIDVVLEAVGRALERQASREISNFKKGHSSLATVASTAPFIGLLGTVMGIVTSFEKMASSGAGGLGTVSAGIAEALVATALGLLVAIPAVMVYNYFNGWVEARGIDLAEASNELIDVVTRRLHSENPGPVEMPTYQPVAEAAPPPVDMYQQQMAPPGYYPGAVPGAQPQAAPSFGYGAQPGMVPGSVPPRAPSGYGRPV